jgi:hypothetical protein
MEENLASLSNSSSQLLESVENVFVAFSLARVVVQSRTKGPGFMLRMALLAVIIILCLPSVEGRGKKKKKKPSSGGSVLTCEAQSKCLKVFLIEGYRFEL